MWKQPSLTPMLTLAPVRYARILRAAGGPVGLIALGRLRIGGVECYRAGAQLSDRGSLPIGERALFGPIDGSGTDRSPLLARYKAISEALERWAYHECHGSGRGDACGLHLDPTSSGMAAFPGLWKGQARRQARREAVERWCLVEWWAGLLEHRPLTVPYPGLSGIEIDNPIGRDRMVIIWGKLANGRVAYGYSAARSLREATWKALVEQTSCAEVLAELADERAERDPAPWEDLKNELERRVLYYSSTVGHRRFRERLDKPVSTARNQAPSPVFDTEVPGPWSRYATVWRVLYPTRRRDHHDPESLTFFW